MERVAPVTERSPLKNFRQASGRNRHHEARARESSDQVTLRALSPSQRWPQLAQEQAPRGSPPAPVPLSFCPIIWLSDLESSPAPAPPVLSWCPEARPLGGPRWPLPLCALRVPPLTPSTCCMTGEHPEWTRGVPSPTPSPPPQHRCPPQPLQGSGPLSRGWGRLPYAAGRDFKGLR